MILDLLAIVAWIWLGCIVVGFLGLLYVFIQYLKDCVKAMGK